VSTQDPSRRSGDRLAGRLAHQWAQRRDPRPTEAAPVLGGVSNFSRAEVPWGLDLAAAWAWRLIVIGIATYAFLRGVEYFAELTIPVIVALLISALGAPAVSAMERIGIRRGLGAAIVVLGGLAVVATMLAFAGQQVVSGANDLATQVSDGLGEIRNWLNTGPFHLSDKQINDYIQKAQSSLKTKAQQGAFLSSVTDIGSVLTHMLAGLFLVLFSTYFFLADGARIWAWFVRLAPRVARSRVDSSGRVAWISLTQFVRATVIVAITDAVGVMIAAKILDVQFVLAIGVLVFLGAFVPIVGAFLAGTVAVLVALVDHGFVVALIMLGAVVVVQQIESHPLGIIIAIAAGILVAGVAGALVAVPFAAAANAVVQHLASQTKVGEDPEEALDSDLEEAGETADTEAPSDPPPDTDDGHVGDTDQAGVADQFDESPEDPGGEVRP
jgi:predicted PurR-regulated permease PerM